jgi:hypothetical protein
MIRNLEIYILRWNITAIGPGRWLYLIFFAGSQKKYAGDDYETAKEEYG